MFSDRENNYSFKKNVCMMAEMTIAVKVNGVAAKEKVNQSGIT